LIFVFLLVLLLIIVPPSFFVLGEVLFDFVPFFFGERTGDVVNVDAGTVESIIVLILGNDAVEFDERKARRSSDVD
jgi:hypothetical protein